MKFISYFCNQENVLTLDHSLSDLVAYNLAHFSLILVKVGGIYVPVSNIDSVLHNKFAFSSPQLKVLKIEESVKQILVFKRFLHKQIRK